MNEKLDFWPLRELTLAPGNQNGFPMVQGRFQIPNLWLQIITTYLLNGNTCSIRVNNFKVKVVLGDAKVRNLIAGLFSVFSDFFFTSSFHTVIWTLSRSLGNAQIDIIIKLGISNSDGYFLKICYFCTVSL